MVENETILAWVGIVSLFASVVGLYLRSKKDHGILSKLQSTVDAQREAIAVLGKIAKTQKKSVKIQQDQLNLDGGIALLKVLGILDKDGVLVGDPRA
jgi:ubiquinone biosynthesis protein UbiJ